jgi:transposase
VTFPDQLTGTRRRRRLHSNEFKANAVAASMQPGMSMAAVAMAHGVNAHLLRRWVSQAEMTPLIDEPGKYLPNVQVAPVKSAIVPVSLPAPEVPVQMAEIRIELQRGATAVTVRWPASAASECAAWMREQLR